MFPSGQWTGHFDQNGRGRQVMHDLTITFRDGELIGRGWDYIGPFSLSGRVLPENRVEMVKKYEDRHSVVYLGEHDGEGTISGAWSLSGDDGTFAIRAAGGFREVLESIQERKF